MKGPRVKKIHLGSGKDKRPESKGCVGAMCQINLLDMNGEGEVMYGI